MQIALNDIPEGLQIVCISRNRPASLFSRLSLAGDLLEINPALLRFTEAESTRFLAWLNPDINAQTSFALQEKAKGWAIALVLLSQKKSKDIQTPLLDKPQEVFSFLLMDILADMNKTSLQFLAKTSIFNQFTIAMAIALTGYRNAQGILDDLVNKNFLIDRTDEAHPVYCYHPILRDFLIDQNKTQLTEEQLNEVKRTAIKILIDQNKIEEVIPLYLQLQDWSGLKPLLLKHSESLINNGRHHAVITWIEHLPKAMLE